MILPARTAVISPRNSEPQINPCFVTKQNSAHRHHCRVAATLPAKNIRLTCTQKMLLFFFCMALHSFTRCAVLCGAATTTVHPSLCFSLSPSVSVAQVADGVAYRRFHVGKVKRPCALTHSLTPMRQVCPSPLSLSLTHSLLLEPCWSGAGRTHTRSAEKKTARETPSTRPAFSLLRPSKRNRLPPPTTTPSSTSLSPSCCCCFCWDAQVSGTLMDQIPFS